MSKKVTYYCDVCEKAIDENDSGYGFLPYGSGRSCVFGALEDYDVHLCKGCIREIACVADTLKEGGNYLDSDK